MHDRITAWLALGFAALLLTGCGTRVTVLDEAGRPVAGAEVQPVFMSFVGDAMVTNARGDARLHLRLTPQRIRVAYPDGSAEGYEWPASVVQRGLGVALDAPHAADSTMASPSESEARDHAPARLTSDA